LTFNSHRIHYDRPYAMEAEGYPGLVVHGPLLATLLADLARRARPDDAWRTSASRPCVPQSTSTSCASAGGRRTTAAASKLWAQDHEGRLTMQAAINFTETSMDHQIPTPDAYQEIRDALRDLCGKYDPAYWQKVDADRGYPEAFVDALTEAGWMAALIPNEFGGSGLGLAEASVIMEEINFSGGNSGALHGQMYNMNTVLRHGSIEQKNKYLPEIADRQAAPAGDGSHGADDRHGHHPAEDHRREEG
jgi:hypothetical protein